MHWFTHALLGAALAQWMLGRQLGNRALAAGALLGIVPELESLASMFASDGTMAVLHHGPWHSLLIAVIVAIGAGAALKRIWRTSNLSQQQLTGFAFAIGAVHLLVDCLTVDGVTLAWPFSNSRISFGLIDWRDPLFTLPLAVTVMWLAFIKEPKPKRSRSPKKVPMPKRQRLCLWGLGISAGYLLLACGAKSLANAGFERDLHRYSPSQANVVTAPTMGNILLWRAVVKKEDAYWVGYRSVFEGFSTPVQWTVLPIDENALAAIEKSQPMLVQSSPWWIARSTARGGWLGEVRRGEVRVWGRKKGTVDTELETVYELNERGVQHLTQPSHGGEEFHRTVGRIFGNKDMWQGGPRLYGVTGSLPEYLGFEELPANQ